MVIFGDLDNFSSKLEQQSSKEYKKKEKKNVSFWGLISENLTSIVTISLGQQASLMKRKLKRLNIAQLFLIIMGIHSNLKKISITYKHNLDQASNALDGAV